jgi:CheY-like chemotaxis protein
MNLVINARDAMPGAGELVIETGTLNRGKTYAMLAVTDTGEGMDEATKRRVFEPFFTTKDVGKGTGLGLSTVQGIVAQSGGFIDIDSEEGKGTTFRIYLPALALPLAADAADAAMPAATRVLGGKETVLVVDDQEEVRRFAAAALEEYGYRVFSADNAASALQICQREPVDLVLTDVVMPRVGGQELAAGLKFLKPGIRIMFMSGYADKVIAQDGVVAEGVRLIQKPFSPEDLAVQIRAALGSPEPARTRILVADDDAGVRAFLAAVLASGGYEVVEAVDGRQALRQVRAGGADLAIVDLVMPEQDGLETIPALRSELPGMGIIAISGAFGGQFLETATLLGADAVLSKPVSAELLLAKVIDVLELRR